jgi:hypothetical protein
MLGISPPKIEDFFSKKASKRCLCINHGHVGALNRSWEVRLKVLSKTKVPAGGNFHLVETKKHDSKGNEIFCLRPTEKEDERFLIFLSAVPGFDGEVKVTSSGSIKYLKTCGRNNRSVYPVAIVSGPCEIMVERTGELRGTPGRWSAVYNGESWGLLR